MRTLIAKLAFGLILASLSTVPAALAHDTQCGGGATTGGLCLIVCDQTHRAFPGRTHSCSYTASSYCNLIDITRSTFDVREICALV